MKRFLQIIILLPLLNSCSVEPYDVEEVLARNKVKIIHEKYFSVENGKLTLKLESFTYIARNGKADSVKTILYGSEAETPHRKLYYYNPFFQLDSVVTATKYDTINYIHSDIYFYNSFFLLDSVQFYLTSNGNRSLLSSIINSSSSEYDLTSTRYDYPSRIIRSEEFIQLDDAGKKQYTKNHYYNANGMQTTECYDYQYDNSGKLLSRKLKNNGIFTYLHNLEYLENDLRKNLVITNMDGDTVSVHRYRYEYYE